MFESLLFTIYKSTYMFRLGMDKVTQVTTEAHPLTVEVTLGPFVFKGTFSTVLAVTL